LESLGFEWKRSGTVWEIRLSELADFRKIHGHCNVPSGYSKNALLGRWVTSQKTLYRFHLEGKTSSMTLSRIKGLGSLGFEWRVGLTAWEDCLSELAEYRKTRGHCNVPKSKLANWVAMQRTNYKLHLKGKKSCLTLSRIRELESLGFECTRSGTVWEIRLSELADYRKTHGHCNVPYNYSKNAKLANWIGNQRQEYALHLKGKRSMTLSRIQALKSLDFEWGVPVVAVCLENLLSELADYRNIHGHCNVPKGYSENTQLARWIITQRQQYRLRLEGKTSNMTIPHIQKLEGFGFEWDSRGAT
jgi:hypothetical protein